MSYAARVDTSAFSRIPLRLTVIGEEPDSIDVNVGCVTAKAKKTATGYVAMFDTSALEKGRQVVSVFGKRRGLSAGITGGELVVEEGSHPFTTFSSDGPSYGAHLEHNLDVDAPATGHWLVKMRVVDRSGKAAVDTLDLTAGQAAFAPTQAGADAHGFSAAWLHITPELNVPKLFVAVVDIKSGALVGTPTPVEGGDWDTQLFGHSLIAMPDGSFRLVYTANDTAAAVNPKSACNESLERDLLFAVTIDKTGKIVGKPAPIFDHEGTREYPRIAAHPEGFALFWEDQRSECMPSGGHVRMAFDVVDPTFTKLLDPYLEVPGSIGLPPEDPTLAVTGSNFAVAWSDNRDGQGLADPKPELFLDTYWH